jgi:hypothetical protein
MEMDETLYKNEERIERYLYGEMTPEEEEIFEENLANDDTLRRQAEAMARIVKGMEAVGGEQDRLMIEKMKAANGKRLAPVWWMTIAASLVIIFTVGYHFYDRSQTIGLGQQYAYVFSTETESLIRGEEDEDVANKLNVLFDNAANGKDLDNTIKQLDELWALSKSDTYNGYTTYEPYIGWNLAIAHLRNNDKKKATSVLEELAELYPEGTALGDKIAELLKEL